MAKIRQAPARAMHAGESGSGNRETSMQPKQPIKFRFRIRARAGMEIGGITVHGSDLHHAERKLARMYPFCEVLSCEESPFSRDMQRFLALQAHVAERSAVR